MTIGALLFSSCRTSNAQETNSESFEDCLPSVFSTDLQLLLTSFEGFLERKYDGELDKFINEFLKREFPKVTDFESEDILDAQRLRLNGFYDSIYTSSEKKYEEGEIRPPRTAGDEEEKPQMELKVDRDKSYLKCLIASINKEEFVKNHIGYYNRFDDVSPFVIGQDVLKIKGTAEYNTKIVKIIVAVEIYYMILDSASRGNY